MEIGQFIDYKGKVYEIVDMNYRNGEKCYDLVSKDGEYLLNQLIRYCRYLNKPFIPRRRNQYYITSNLRYKRHNEEKDNTLKKKVTNILNTNYKILTNLKYNDVGKYKVCIVAIEELLEKGFNPVYFTHFCNHEGINSMGLYNFIMQYSKDNLFVTIINK